MAKNEKDFLKEIKSEIKSRKRSFHRTNQFHVSLVLLVAATGALTAAAGVSQNQSMLLFSPSALVVYGIIAAVAAAALQLVSSGARSPSFKHTVKIALEGIRDRVEYAKLNLDDAARLMTHAKTRPDEVLDELGRSPSK